MLRKRLYAIVTASAVVGAMVAGAPAAHADEPDTTPPTITIISPVENQQVQIGVDPLPTVQYACDDDVAVDTCDASIGTVGSPAEPTTVGNGMPLDLLTPGHFVLTVRSTDTSGNQAQSTAQFEMVGGQQLDETPPSIDIVVPVDGAQVKKGTVLRAN